MRTTVTLDDALLRKVRHLSGLMGRGQLMRQVLEALIERESARRLSWLAGSEPQLASIHRRRHASE